MESTMEMFPPETPHDDDMFWAAISVVFMNHAGVRSFNITDAFIEQTMERVSALEIERTPDNLGYYVRIIPTAAVN